MQYRTGITIDSESSMDLDDALWITGDRNKAILEIHIANVSGRIRRGDRHDLIARTRLETVYRSSFNVPMFPRYLSEDSLSLLPHQKKGVVSISVELTESETILKSIVFTYLISLAKLSYKEVDKLIETDERLSLLEYWTRHLSDARAQRGSIGARQIGDVYIDEDGRIREKALRSQQIVAETAILANSLIAKFLADRNVPAIYRSHKIRDGADKWGAIAQDIPNICKFLAHNTESAKYVIKPESHFALGIEYYCHYTSPIRRYVDLVNHRILYSVITKQTHPYSLNELQQIADDANKKRELEREASRTFHKNLYSQEVEQLLVRQNYSSLSSKDFSKILAAAIASNKFSAIEDEVKTRLQNKSIQLKDLFYLLFSQDEPYLAEECLEYFQSNLSDCRSVLAIAETIKSWKVECETKSVTQTYHLSRVVIDGKTSSVQSPGANKKEAQNKAYYQWIADWSQDKLIPVEDAEQVVKDVVVTIDLVEPGNYVSSINEYAQQWQFPPAVYEINPSGNGFKAVCRFILSSEVSLEGSGWGENKKQAKQEAAKNVWEQIEQLV